MIPGNIHVPRAQRHPERLSELLHTPDLLGPSKPQGIVRLWPVPLSQAPRGTQIPSLHTYAHRLDHRTPNLGKETRGKEIPHSSAPSTYHHLCSKHVLVPNLKVLHFLQDHFLVLSGLEEVRTSENRGVARGFVPFHVDGVWLVIGINTPGGKREVTSFKQQETPRFHQADSQLERGGHDGGIYK